MSDDLLRALFEHCGNCDTTTSTTTTSSSSSNNNKASALNKVQRIGFNLIEQNCDLPVHGGKSD